MNKIVSSIWVFCIFGILCNACHRNTKKSETSELPQTVQIISDSISWADRMALSVIKRNPQAWQTENDSMIKWNYKIGLLMTSFEHLYKKTNNEKYSQYINDYAEQVIDSAGNILAYDKEEYNIDMINSGKFLFHLYDKSGKSKYLWALKSLRHQLIDHPRTKSGGLWHKKIYPNQMWLDGLYMGAPFYAQYNTTFENGDEIDDVVKQFRLIYKKTYDEPTGLLYHAWDESKQMDWADKVSGKSPHFWSRSMGWYLMALVDVLDYIPENHSGHGELIDYLNNLSNALIKFQDKSGTWYQVTNLPNREGNYLESSSTCMFAYAFAKGVKKGYLPNKFSEHAQKAFQGILDKFITIDGDGEIHIHQVCGSAGLGGNPYRDGSFEYYIGEKKKTDNLHGTGPFILAALATGN